MSAVRRIYRAASATAGIEVLGMALGYVGQVALARWLGVDKFGVFALVSALALVLAIPAQLGFSVLIVRDASTARVEQSPSATRGLLRRAYQIAIAVSIAIVLVASAVDLCLSTHSPYSGDLTIGMLALPFLVCSALNIAFARALGRIGVVKALFEIGRPLIMLAGISACFVLSIDASSGIALGLFTSAALVAAAIQFFHLGNLRPTILRGARPRYETSRWLVAAAPFALVGAIDVVMRQIDLLMVGGFLPSDQVGQYAVASRMATLVTLSMIGINMLAASTYADLYRKNDLSGMQALARQLAHGMFWPAVAVAIALAVAGRWLIGWFGPGFHAAYWPMVILAVGSLFNVGAGSVGYLANMTGHQWLAVRIQGVAATLNICLNALLIPRFDLIGAALATAISVTFANIYLHVVVTRRVGVRSAVIYAGLPWSKSRYNELPRS